MIFHNTIELDGILIISLDLLLFACLFLVIRRLTKLEAKNQVLLTQIEILLRAVTTRQNKVATHVRTQAISPQERPKTRQRDYQTTTDNPGRQSEVKSTRRDGTRDEPPVR